MDTVYVFLAEGFEEIEALTPVDILRRAGVNVRTVALAGTSATGSHSITVLADVDGTAFALPQDAAMVVLPGGPGTQLLQDSAVVAQALRDAAARELYIAAICAAPTVLYNAGLLDGKRATAFPARQKEMANSNVTGAAVEVDGKIITARSAGVALEFAHALAEALVGKGKADEVVHNVYPEE